MQSRLFALLGALLLVGVAGCGSSAGVGGFRSELTSTRMVSAFVGANVYIPATVVVVAGAGHTLQVFNATEQPHGFAIADLGVEVVLEPGVETRVPLPQLEGGRVHRIHCQLHAAHREATLVVLEREG